MSDKNKDALELKRIAAGLTGLANHVRAVPQYSKLLGDMEVVDEAIAALARRASQVSAAAPAAWRYRLREFGDKDPWTASNNTRLVQAMQEPNQVKTWEVEPLFRASEGQAQTSEEGAEEPDLETAFSEFITSKAPPGYNLMTWESRYVWGKAWRAAQLADSTGAKRETGRVKS